MRTWAKITDQETIAAKLGITARTLRTHFKDELAVGKFDAVAAVGGKLLTQALKGNVACMIFYLKTQGKWNTRVEHTGADGGPIQTVDISKALEDLSEEQLANLEPILEQLLSGPGANLDFRAQLGVAADQDEAE